MRISDWSSDVCSSDLQSRIAPALDGQKPRWRRGCLDLRSFGFGRGVRRARLAARRPFAAAWGEADHESVADAADCFRSHGDTDRKSVVEGKGVSVRVDVGGSRVNKKKK